MPHEANPDQDPDQSSNHRLNTSRKYKWLGRAAAVTGALSIPAMAGGFLARNAEAKASSGSVPEMVSGHEGTSPEAFLKKFEGHLADLKKQIEANPKTIKLTPDNLKNFYQDKQLAEQVKQEFESIGMAENLILYAPSKDKPGTFVQLMMGVNKDGNVISAAITDGYKKKITDLIELAMVDGHTLTSKFGLEQYDKHYKYTPDSATLTENVPAAVSGDPAKYNRMYHQHTFTIGPAYASPGTVSYENKPAAAGNAYTSMLGYLHYMDTKSV